MQPERRNAIAARYVYLIEPIARLLRGALPPSFELQELVQVGHLALLEAAERHDANPEAFGAYLKFRVRGAMLDFVRANYPVSAIPETPVSHPETSPDEGIAVRQAVAKLPGQERAVISASFRHSTQRAIAGHVGLSQSRVCEIRRAAVRRLRILLAPARAA